MEYDCDEGDSGQFPMSLSPIFGSPSIRTSQPPLLQTYQQSSSHPDHSCVDPYAGALAKLCSSPLELSSPPGPSTFPPMAAGTSISAINRSNGSDYNSFSSVVTPTRQSFLDTQSYSAPPLMPHLESPKRDRSSDSSGSCYSSDSSQSSGFSDPANPSDPFLLELHKIFPPYSALNHASGSNNSKLKRLTTKQSSRASHSAAPSVVSSVGPAYAGPTFNTPCVWAPARVSYSRTPTRNNGGSVDIDYYAGLQLLLTARRLPPGQVRMYSVMINQLCYASNALFHDKAGNAVDDCIIEEIIEMAESIISVYEEINECLKRQEKSFNEVKAYLPDLEIIEDMEELRMGVKIYKKRLQAHPLPFIDPNSISLFDYFSKFYDTALYNPFITLLHRYLPNATEPLYSYEYIRYLYPPLTAVYAILEDVVHRSRDLKRATKDMLAALFGARQKLWESEELALSMKEARKARMAVQRSAWRRVNVSAAESKSNVGSAERKSNVYGAESKPNVKLKEGPVMKGWLTGADLVKWRQMVKRESTL